MSFLNSLFLGTESAYNALGIDVIFIKNKQAISSSTLAASDSKISPIFSRSMGYLGADCLPAKTFHIVTLGYAHVLVHEMGVLP